jgi:L-iditol 2-dehydrogenase
VNGVRLHGPADLRYEKLLDPEPGPGDVLVQVEVALTDSADLATFRRGHADVLDELPAPLGHQFAGIDVATGRRVVGASSAPCGACPACHAGHETLCRRLEVLTGAFAELLLVPERIVERSLLPVPAGLAPEVAALLEPLACCLHGVERAEVKPGNVVAVLGVGPIGLLLCACVADAGGWPVTVGGRPERHRLAPAFGARPGDPHDADVVIEAAGTAEAWNDALELVQPGGTVVFVGGLEPGAGLRVDAHRLRDEELSLRGSFGHAPRHVKAALTFLASGAYPWERLITHEVGLPHLPELFAEPPDELLKAAVRP